MTDHRGVDEQVQRFGREDDERRGGQREQPPRVAGSWTVSAINCRGRA